jgi:hypothetical protein
MKKTWTVDLDGQQHSIDLQHGWASGKRIIWVDGVEEIRATNLLDAGSTHQFPVGSHVGTVRIKPDWSRLGMTFKAELVIDSDSVADAMPEPMKKAEGQIKTAYWAAVISGVVTLALSLFGGGLLGFDLWSLLDVAVIWLLAFGVFKKNRACSILLLGYYLSGQIMLRLDTGQAGGIPLAIVFTVFFIQGIRGTFAYHRLTKQSSAPFEAASST